MTNSDSQRKSYTSDGGTNVPLIHISSYEYEQEQASRAKGLPQLPSQKYQYSVWHDLRNIDVKGDELRAPRVREGPESKEKTFDVLTDESGDPIHHGKSGKEKTKHRNQLENWEEAKHVNLSYQKLNQAYQRKNLTRILQRLKSAEEIVLIDNSLVDLSNLAFPRCRIINLSKNYINSFKKLPKMPVVEHIILSENQISGEAGLDRFPSLQTLELWGNGITYQRYYRQRIFKKLPDLQMLDNVLRSSSDLEEPGVYKSDSCTLL